ncbi:MULTISPECIES: Nramp family divalent metal transporter [unclassified Actinopolyspora]|uniref:Nramp family divalent metal transporter n=1 Tax=unclassified Actinopolyspora TaxID=2639451 RepID=UPI0013F632D4|nr:MULTISPECIES: Nramp family divalent metal transporter [unclassified Actinopolyspora]NHD15956.1 divalent metal cation transporter [Actinopolyspora sp. BKK2]NHE74830.1 divalent metal cation transporter [Actinopolyspora sp. BKK1]
MADDAAKIESTAPGTGATDPYALRPEDVREAPTTLSGRLRHLGPGLVLSAAVVGSGELIVTTSLGARAGFVLLWLVIISTAVKVWVQLELAGWTILTGKPALRGFAQIPPRIGRVGWINWLWIAMDFTKMIQRGGIIGGVAVACSILWPIVGTPLSFPSVLTWTALITAGLVLLLHSGRYSVVERSAVVAVGFFTVSTVALALGLPLTPFAYGLEDIGTGMSFAIPSGTLGIAVSMFGLTGVGADEMTTYTYWCLEKGYARWTGPDDGTEQRARRAEGWLRVMRLDVLVSWLVCTVCTFSFYVIGAAVLRPQNLVPSGNEMITTLSRIYTDTMGPWAEYLFLFGAIAVLGATAIGSAASVPRLWTNTLGLLGIIDWDDPVVRHRTIRVLTMSFPPLWAAFYLFARSPVLMVQIGGMGSGAFLIAVVAAVWRLRFSEVDSRFRSGKLPTAALVVSSIAIGVLGLYTIADVFGLGPG